MTRDSGQKEPRQEEYTPGRRRFLEAVSVALSGAIAAMIGLPVLGFLLEPLLRKTPPVWRAVGKVSAFKVGQTVKVAFEDASPLPWSGGVAKTAAWLRRENANNFTAFSINCTHLGCPVRWEASSTLFFCPCHGGVYYQDGSVAAGPPLYALPRYPVRVRNGQVEIQTTPVPITTSLPAGNVK